MDKKITIIGGGSSTFVPHLLRLFLQSAALKGSTITLMDVDSRRLEVMDTLARRLVEKEGADLTVRSSTEQRASLAGADFVIVAIAVGGLAAWEADVEIAGRYGIFSEIHDSIGPGGMMRAFRHVPVLASICEDLQEVSPHAFVFNYTNPATANALAMRTVPSISSVSLCSCVAAPCNPQWLGAWAGVPSEEIAMPPLVAGINHCTGIVALRLMDGRDAVEMIRRRSLHDVAGSIQETYRHADAAMIQRMQETYGVTAEELFAMFLDSIGLREPVVPWIMDTFGVVPYCWTHWVEFFPQLLRLAEPYTGRAQGLRMKYGRRVVDTRERQERARKWQDLAERWSSPEHVDEVALAALPGGEEDQGIEVVDIIEDILGNRNAVHIVNTTNYGAIDNLPADAVVEVNALVGAYGIRPLHVGPLPEALAAHLRRHIATQQLTVQAALGGDRRTALQAFLLDPATSARLEPADTARLLDDMLQANARYLPRFT
jgi:alpha-galactosidase